MRERDCDHCGRPERGTARDGCVLVSPSPRTGHTESTQWRTSAVDACDVSGAQRHRSLESHRKGAAASQSLLHSPLPPTATVIPQHHSKLIAQAHTLSLHFTPPSAMAHLTIEMRMVQQQGERHNTERDGQRS